VPGDAASTLRRALLPVELAEAERKAKPSAAVLVLLREGPRGLEVLLVQRIQRREDPWSGQIGLPGGMHRPQDGTLLETAVRETREEVGLDLGGAAEILGHLPARSPGNLPAILVVPFVALGEGDLRTSPGSEIAMTFWASLTDLAGARATVTIATAIGELTVPAFLHEGKRIWGFTYRVLEDLLALLQVET